MKKETIDQRLELIRGINCLDQHAVANAFDGDEHHVRKYVDDVITHGPMGRYKFVMSLDYENVKKLFDYMGVK